MVDKNIIRKPHAHTKPWDRIFWQAGTFIGLLARAPDREASRLTADALLTEIRSFLSVHADPVRAEKNSRYFTEGYDAYGVGQNELFGQKDVWLERYRDELGLSGFLNLGDMLVTSGKYEEASLAVLFLEAFRDDIGREEFTRLGSWFETGFVNWGHTDVACSLLIGPLLTAGTIAPGDIAPWRTSCSKWMRRAVPVALIPYLKRTGDCKPLLAFIDDMMEDADRFVQQGLGWFLREAWKLEPTTVEAFLLHWKDAAPRLIIRYATEKMDKGERGRFRAEKCGKKK